MNSNRREQISKISQQVRQRVDEDQFWGLKPKKIVGAAHAPPLPKPTAASPINQSSLFDSVATPTKKLSLEESRSALEKLAQEIRVCKKCRLCETRTNAVPGEGNPQPRLLFIGEGPGATEDETGRPFVGRAGKLLTDMIEKGMKIKREDVFIANIVKCRPPENREPAPDEIVACMPYLREQIDLLNPELIITLGRPATSTMLETPEGIGKLRGRIHFKHGRKILPTFHPAYLLRNPPDKVKAWADLQVAMKELGL